MKRSFTLSSALFATIFSAVSLFAQSSFAADETKNDPRLTYTATSQVRVRLATSAEISGDWLYLGRAVDASVSPSISGNYSPDGIIDGEKLINSYRIVSDAFGSPIITSVLKRIDVKTGKTLSTNALLLATQTSTGVKTVSPRSSNCQSYELCNLSPKNLLICQVYVDDAGYGCPRVDGPFAYTVYRKISPPR